MGDLQGPARWLILFGAILMGLGVLLLIAPKLPWIGKLPGDILIKRDGFVFYAPLASSLLVSLALSLLLWLLSRGR
jgi:hypothetical protein